MVVSKGTCMYVWRALGEGVGVVFPETGVHMLKSPNKLSSRLLYKKKNYSVVYM